MAHAQETTDILLIEDSAADAQLVREALRECPHARLQCLPDGQAALAALQHLAPEPDGAIRPGFILLDLNLPRLDGRDVLRARQADPVLARIPIVVLSTSAHPADVAACYDLGANAFVTKPLDLDAFLTTVQAIARFWCHTAALPARAGVNLPS